MKCSKHNNVDLIDSNKMSFKVAVLVVLLGICSALGAYVQPTIWPQVNFLDEFGLSP